MTRNLAPHIEEGRLVQLQKGPVFDSSFFNKTNQAGLGPATSNPSNPCIGSSVMASKFRLEFSAASLSSSLIACFSSHPS